MNHKIEITGSVEKELLEILNNIKSKSFESETYYTDLLGTKLYENRDDAWKGWKCYEQDPATPATSQGYNPHWNTEYHILNRILAKEIGQLGHFAVGKYWSLLSENYFDDDLRKNLGSAINEFPRDLSIYIAFLSTKNQQPQSTEKSEFQLTNIESPLNEYIRLLKKRINLWLAGYGILCDVNGTLYLYWWKNIKDVE